MGCVGFPGLCSSKQRWWVNLATWGTSWVASITTITKWPQEWLSADETYNDRRAGSIHIPSVKACMEGENLNLWVNEINGSQICSDTDFTRAPQIPISSFTFMYEYSLLKHLTNLKWLNNLNCLYSTAKLSINLQFYNFHIHCTSLWGPVQKLHAWQYLQSHIQDNLKQQTGQLVQ